MVRYTGDRTPKNDGTKVWSHTPWRVASHRKKSNGIFCNVIASNEWADIETVHQEGSSKTS